MRFTKSVRAAVVSLLLVLTTACGGAEPAFPGPHDGPVLSAPSIVGGPVTQIPPLAPAVPKDLRIDAIDASSTLIPLGKNADRTVSVPPVDQPMQASWYRLGAQPGTAGAAVILGHVNGGGKDGIFARLHELKPGDQVKVSRADGSTALFTVTRLDQVAKSAFPTEAVYAPTPGAELRLITCGGSFDSDRRSYRDNIIVYAALTGVA
ncbi:MAG: class F sortase [Pseudonocardia sp.]|jgi:hypothetical protein